MLSDGLSKTCQLAVSPNTNLLRITSSSPALRTEPGPNRMKSAKSCSGITYQGGPVSISSCWGHKGGSLRFLDNSTRVQLQSRSFQSYTTSIRRTTHKHPQQPDVCHNLQHVGNACTSQASRGISSSTSSAAPPFEASRTTRKRLTKNLRARGLLPELNNHSDNRLLTLRANAG